MSDELLEIMTSVSAPRRRYKVVGGWLGEKLGRAKLNGRLLGRSPLSELVELELLRLGLDGQSAMWRILLEMEPRDARLNRAQLESLLQRTTSFADELEGFRLEAA